MRRVPAGKTALPDPPRAAVARPALLAHLDRARPDQVVAVIAPAGFGKSLLLADWARRGGPPTAWVTLDRDDDGPRFWSAVLTAVRALPGVPPVGRFARLAAPGAPIAGPDLVDGFVDALEELPGPVRLVVDDVDEAEGREPLRELARLVRHRPAGLRLVLASRADPALGLARLRVEGRLHELRVDRLRFTREEAEALLRSGAPELAPEHVAALHERTEGWVAGLRLAALALRRSTDTARFVAEFSGDERSVADYLTGEVLAGLPPATLQFLRAVSVCGRSPTGLATALSGRRDAARLLEEIAGDTALVERTGPGLYRLHALLRTYLVAGLARHHATGHHVLHGVAARWWAEAGEPVHALRHAERAEDTALLAGILRGAGVGLLLDGETTSVRRGLDALGPEVTAADPRLGMLDALTHLGTPTGGAVRSAVGRARRAARGRPDPDVRVLRASVDLLGAGLGVDDAGPGREGDPPEPPSPQLAALLHVSRGAAELGPDPAGDPERARRDLVTAVGLARTHGHAYLEVQALTMLAALAGRHHDHPGTVEHARAAVAAAERCGRHPSPWTAVASGMLAYADLLAGDPVAARDQAEEVRRTGGDLPPDLALTVGVVRGAARSDLGDRAAGLAEVRAARRAAAEVRWPPALFAAAALLEHRAALVLGNAAAADEVLAWLAERVGRTGEVLLLEAWTAAAVGHHEAARAAVRPVRRGQVPLLLPGTPLEVLLVEAEAALHGDDGAAGASALDAALRLAGGLGVARPLVLAGPRSRELMGTRPAARGTGRTAALLAAARAAVAGGEASLLSEREMVVLGLLPSLLTTGEIADELTVSVNTVKSHVRAIYAKLDASSRREAVLRARERGLLP